MGVGMGSQKFVGWGGGVSLPARNRICSFYVKRFERTYGDPPQHFTPRVPPSFKVTQVFGSDMGRSASYDILLMICGNHGPISYRFRNKRRYRSKIANFSDPAI